MEVLVVYSLLTINKHIDFLCHFYSRKNIKRNQKKTRNDQSLYVESIVARQVLSSLIKFLSLPGWNILDCSDVRLWLILNDRLEFYRSLVLLNELYLAGTFYLCDSIFAYLLYVLSRLELELLYQYVWRDDVPINICLHNSV